MTADGERRAIVCGSSNAETRRSTYLIEPQSVFEPYFVRLLERAGLAIVGTSRTFDRRALDQADPDLVVVDVDFAEGGALRVVRALRDGVPRTRIVACTDNVEPHFAARCYIAGANAVLEKGTEEEFVRILTRVAAGGDDEASRTLKAAL